jgi:hypothetical protein
MLNEAETLKHNRKLEYGEFLDKVAQRIADRAKERNVPGLFRLANVWRFNSAEATITPDESSNDFVVTYRCGPNASRISQCKAGSVDSTADAIIDKLYWLRHTAGNDH